MSEVYTDLESRVRHISVKCVLKPYQHRQDGKWEATFKGQKVLLDGNTFTFVISEMDNLNEIYDYINLGEIVSLTIENKEGIGLPLLYLVPLSDVFAQKALEETTNYYKDIIKTSAVYLRDFINVLENEQASSYYVNRNFINISELKDVYKRLISESYGAA